MQKFPNLKLGDVLAATIDNRYWFLQNNRLNVVIEIYRLDIAGILFIKILTCKGLIKEIDVRDDYGMRTVTIVEHLQEQT